MSPNKIVKVQASSSSQATWVSNCTAGPINACPACDSSVRTSFGYKCGSELFRCIDCGSISGASIWDLDSTVVLYDRYYDGARFETEQSAAVSLRELAASFEPFRRSGRWLDLGYGEGGLLAAAEGLGWYCYGVEISPRSLDFGNRRGWVVSSDADRDPRFRPQGFDVVTMIEFLEHVEDPQIQLRRALRWLRPGGLLYVTTPNADSLNRLCLGLEWSIFRPPEHLTIWTARGLRSALSRAGFQCTRTRTDGFNPCEILARLRRAWQPGDVAPVDRNQTAFALNRALSTSPLRRAIKRGVNSCLSAFGIGDSLKIWAVKAE